VAGVARIPPGGRRPQRLLGQTSRLDRLPPLSRRSSQGGRACSTGTTPDKLRLEVTRVVESPAATHPQDRVVPTSAVAPGTRLSGRWTKLGSDYPPATSRECA
jgi:hypothetical protein